MFFEPSGKGDAAMFRNAYELAHIVKYSKEQSGWLAAYRSKSLRAPVEIETMGKAGLRYRATLFGNTHRQWTDVPAYRLPRVKDPAGAGDWCSAGILHFLGRRGQQGLEGVTPTRLLRSLRFGQALAAWTCAFEGARGGMYRVAQAEFRRSVMHIIYGARTHGQTKREEKRGKTKRFITICAACGSSRRRLHLAF